MKIQFVILSTLICFSAPVMKAQEKSGPAKHIKILLPDGKLIDFDKVDSVKKSWGTNNIQFSHNGEDDKNNVMRLIRKSPDQIEASAASHKLQQKMIGQPAASFILTDLQGNSISLASLKGKIVVLNFWFIGCTGCVAEMPELNKLVAKYSPDKVVFLALGRDDPFAVNKFLKLQPFQYHHLPDAVDVANQYNVREYPTSIIIDQRGMVNFITGSEKEIFEVLSGHLDKLAS